MSPMGYILPIQQTQYADYQNRTIQERKNLMYIDEPFQAYLNTTYQKANPTDVREYELLKEEHENNPKRKNNDDQQTNRYINHTLFGELTGKGTLFNDEI